MSLPVFEDIVKLTLSAVQVRKAEDVSRAALGTAVQTRARDVRLALVDAAGSGEGRSGAEESSEELHDDYLGWIELVKRVGES